MYVHMHVLEQMKLGRSGLIYDRGKVIDKPRPTLEPKPCNDLRLRHCPMWKGVLESCASLRCQLDLPHPLILRILDADSSLPYQGLEISRQRRAVHPKDFCEMGKG